MRPDVRPRAPGADPRHASARTSSTPASSTTSSRATRRSTSTAGCCRARPRPTCAPRSSGGSARTSCRRVGIERLALGEPVEAPAEGPFWDTLVATLRDHDPDGVPLPVMAPFATDAKATAHRRHADVRLLAVPPRARRAVPRALPWRRRADLARRAALRATGPLRRRPPLLRLTSPPCGRSAGRGSPFGRSADDAHALLARSCRRRCGRVCHSCSGSSSAASCGSASRSSVDHVPSACWCSTPEQCVSDSGPYWNIRATSSA